MPRLNQDEMTRMLFGVGGVGYDRRPSEGVGTHSEFFSSGPHGETSLAAQHRAARGDPNAEVAPGVTLGDSQAEAERLASVEQGCVRFGVDPQTGAQVPIGTLRPGEVDPNTGEICNPQGSPGPSQAQISHLASQQGGQASQPPTGGVVIPVPGQTQPMSKNTKIALGVVAMLGGYRLVKGRWPW